MLQITNKWKRYFNLIFLNAVQRLCSKSYLILVNYLLLNDNLLLVNNLFANNYIFFYYNSSGNVLKFHLQPQAPILQTAPSTQEPPSIDYSSWGPPPPSSAPDPALVTKISNFHEFKRAGKSLNRNLRRAKDFKNPELLTTLVQFVGIDEIGSNYAKEVWDPHRFSEGDYYKHLDQEQQQLVSAKTAPNTNTKPSSQKRKSQWDLGDVPDSKKQRK